MPLLHHIPEHRRNEGFVHPFASIQHHTETTVYRFPDTDSAAIMKGNKAHTPCRISGKTLDSHIGHDVTSVMNIGRFAERRIRPAHIMMVTSEHDRPDFTVSHHAVEAERDIQSSFRILVENARLGTDNSRFVSHRESSCSCRGLGSDELDRSLPWLHGQLQSSLRVYR